MTRRRQPLDGLLSFWRGLRRPRSPQALLRRRRDWIVGLVLILALLAVADHARRRNSPAPETQSGDMARYHGKVFRVTEVVDGDTLHIDAPDGKKPHTKIRLWGVDTPEVHNVDEPMHFGPQASDYAKAVAANQSVRLELVEADTRDRYGRLLAYVYLPDGTMLNERLLEGGYAYADSRFAHPFKAKFARLEKQARDRQAGLWKDVTTKKMPAWRRRLRESSRRPAAIWLCPAITAWRCAA